MHIKLSNRLFLRQTRNALLVALLLGITISIGQIVYDLSSEQKRIDETVLQVLNTTKESATQSAYSLNDELALRVVKGLFEYQPIYFAEINDDFGRRLAALERPPVKHQMQWLAPLIQADQNLYKIPLHLADGETYIGDMQVRVDRFLIAQNFLDRAGLVIFTGILRNFILSIFFGFLFYFTLGRPVMNTIANLSVIDPCNPGKNQLSVPQGHEEDELGLLVHKLNNILIEFDQTLKQRDLKEEELKRNQNTIRQLNQRLEERVRQRTDELEAANKEMEAFTYSVSHDLRAPLRTIAGFSNILQEDYAKNFDEQGAHYLERVRTGTEKMEMLINDLLKLSRTTRGDLRRSDFNLSELVEEIIAEHHQSDQGRNISIHVSPDIKAYADKRFVRVVLDNLISNAWKYTRNVDAPKIFFGITDKGGQKIYYIQDNGAGFDMAYADKLFAPFKRLHSSKEFEGTGVGLATVQRVIHRHAGEVWADAKVNEGATFFFTLPRPMIDFSNE